MESWSINVITGGVELRWQEKWLESSLSWPPSNPPKFRYKAPNSISQGDCKSSICSACILDLKFLPFSELCTYIRWSRGKKTMSCNRVTLTKLQGFVDWVVWTHTLSYFLRIFLIAVAFIVTYSTSILISSSIDGRSFLKHLRTHNMYFWIPVATWIWRRCLTLELKHPAISEASFINSEKNVWSHTTKSKKHQIDAISQ